MSMRPVILTHAALAPLMSPQLDGQQLLAFNFLYRACEGAQWSAAHEEP